MLPLLFVHWILVTFRGLRLLRMSGLVGWLTTGLKDLQSGTPTAYALATGAAIAYTTYTVVNTVYRGYQAKKRRAELAALSSRKREARNKLREQYKEAVTAYFTSGRGKNLSEETKREIAQLSAVDLAARIRDGSLNALDVLNVCIQRGIAAGMSKIHKQSVCMLLRFAYNAT